MHFSWARYNALLYSSDKSAFDCDSLHGSSHISKNACTFNHSLSGQLLACHGQVASQLINIGKRLIELVLMIRSGTFKKPTWPSPFTQKIQPLLHFQKVTPSVSASMCINIEYVFLFYKTYPEINSIRKDRMSHFGMYHFQFVESFISRRVSS